ncbi:unnamed protein product [Lampetra planeri]
MQVPTSVLSICTICYTTSRLFTPLIPDRDAPVLPRAKAESFPAGSEMLNDASSDRGGLWLVPDQLVPGQVWVFGSAGDCTQSCL